MLRLLAACLLTVTCSAAAAQGVTSQSERLSLRLAHARQDTQPARAAQAASKCAISGRITAGTTGLPGVAIAVTAEGVSSPLTTSSQLDGSYSLEIPGPGRYRLRAELGTFAPVTRDLLVDSSCRARVDIAMVVAGRPAAAAGQPAPPAVAGQTGAPVATRANPAQGLAALFQRVTPRVDPAGAGLAAGGVEDAATIASQLSLPPGFTPETLADTITASASSGRTNDSLLFGAALGGLTAGGGGRPGAAGGASAGGIDNLAGGAGLTDAASVRELTDMAGLNLGTGGMLGTVVRIAGALQSFNKRPHGIGSYNFSSSALNAAPYSITGQPIPDPDYQQQRFSAALGGLLKVPGLFDAGPRTTFFLSYSGGRSSNVYSQYSTVPPAELRAGDFSALPDALRDPLTQKPFPGNLIPADRISSSSRSLLALVPLPNQPGERLNYYYSTTTGATTDDVAFRLLRTFGGGDGGQTGRAGAGRGGRGGSAGAGGGMAGLAGVLGNLIPGMTRGSVNLNGGFQYRRSVNEQANPFPTIGGTSHQTMWNIPVSVGFERWGFTHSVQFRFSRNTSETSNRFAGVRNVAAEAGIAGVSADPFDWGSPSLSFSSFTGLRDLTPSVRTDQAIRISESAAKTRGRHTVRFGGDYAGARVDSRTSANASGTFVFTGIYTGTAAGQFGADFADFLLGLSQQATIQYGPGLERFRSRAFNLFVMDDWRVRSGLTINAGLRYEYQSPYWEADNRLVTLDVPPDFTAAVPVVAGDTGPFTGAFPRTIVDHDWNNLAPRVGVAWKPHPRTTVRGGYAVNYASVPYMSFAERMSAQPPFAVADTRLGALNAPLDMATVFTMPSQAPTTNNFGVDRNYSLGYVHIWNADVQRELGRTVSVGVAYVGTKGSALDIQRAPNRGPTGLVIPGVQPFVWESSEGRSIMHSVSFRARRRLAQGISGGGTYTLSTSKDDASTIGGGAVVVAQNDKDLGAEWGASSFDQRHRLTADFTWELPFGQGRRWLTAETAWSKVFGGWILSGTFIASSGSPFTARVVGNPADVNRGTNGTLRADYNGAEIQLSDPTVERFFNTAAFSVPPAGRFGNSARNTSRGPGSATLNMSVQKSVSLSGLRGFSIRVQAGNVLNAVQWASIDTVVNSPTFGRVVSVRPMRSVQVVARVLF